MIDSRPGFDPRRLVRLMEAAIGRCKLDLHGLTVLTEAATGAYVVTPVLAAMAGAQRVFAVTRESRHGTVDQVKQQTEELAELSRAGNRIQIITGISRDMVAQADIITNSGHARPIDEKIVSWMKPTAVIPLMYEAWEFRQGDVDLAACRHRGIAVAGTNERHPHVDVFSFLGMMAVKLLLDAGIAVYGSRILVLCDNHFGSYIRSGLESAGACVEISEHLSGAAGDGVFDAVLVASQSRPELTLSAGDAVVIAKRWPGAVVAQFWGDIDHTAFCAAGIPLWPPEPPTSGHMGILPSAVGPEPIVRLQSGGLKVGEILWKQQQVGKSPSESLRVLMESGYGSNVPEYGAKDLRPL